MKNRKQMKNDAVGKTEGVRRAEGASRPAPQPQDRCAPALPQPCHRPDRLVTWALPVRSAYPLVFAGGGVPFGAPGSSKSGHRPRKNALIVESRVMWCEAGRRDELVRPRSSPPASGERRVTTGAATLLQRTSSCAVSVFHGPRSAESVRWRPPY